MRTTEIYSTREWKFNKYGFPKRVRQWRWRAIFKQGAIENIVAEGGEGYYNREDCQASYENFKKSEHKIIILDGTD